MACSFFIVAFVYLMKSDARLYPCGKKSNRSISVRLLFLFCSRVLFSRSYENRSKAMFTLYRIAFSVDMTSHLV